MKENYSLNKKRREEAQKKKREEKRLRRLNKNAPEIVAPEALENVVTPVVE